MIAAIVKNRNIDFYVLNGLALVVYILVFTNLKIGVSDKILFSTPDSKTYLDVALWLKDGIDSGSISTRPVLYPVILLVSMKLGGGYGIWFIQLLFWFLTVNFTFLSVKRLTGKSIYAYISAFIILSNLSLIVLTLHALTEVSITFLLSVMLYFISKNKERYKEIHFIHGCLFFLVLMTIIKPVFALPLYATLLLILPVFYFKKYLKSLKSIIILLLILLPLFTQLTIMKVKYNEFKVSMISSNTLNSFLFSQGMKRIENIEREEAKHKAYSLSPKERMNYCISINQHIAHCFFPMFRIILKELLCS